MYLVYFLPSPLHPSNIVPDSTNCVLTVGIRLWHYPTIEAKIPENPDQKDWLDIAKLKPLLLFISLLSMLKKALDSGKMVK